MHNAPAVRYPVGRSRWALGWLLMMIFLGAAGVLAWMVQADNINARQLGVAALWMLTSALGVRGWLHTPSGHLGWDAQGWHWTAFDQSLPVSVEVSLDFQTWLLLRLHSSASGRVLWVWPTRGSAPLQWRALRRALVAHAGPNQQAGRPDSVEPSAA